MFNLDIMALAVVALAAALIINLIVSWFKRD